MTEFAKYGGQGGGFVKSSASTVPSGFVKYKQPIAQNAFDKLTDFGRSTLESFPELFGIEPGYETEQFRARNPVSGFLSQAVGAMVPYIGAAKVARAAPLTGGFIRGAESLGSGAISRGILGGAAEAGVVEAGRLALSATPLPAVIYNTVTGQDKEREKSMLNLAGEGGLNILTSGALGGIGGAISKSITKGVKIHDIIPEAAPDQPMLRQVQALDDWVKQQAIEPTAPPELLTRVETELNRRKRFNLQGAKTKYSDTGEIIGSTGYTADDGDLYRSLVGEKKTTQIGTFLNRLSNWDTKPDGLVSKRRLIVDPVRGGFASQRELDDFLVKTGLTRDEFATNAQDVRVAQIKGWNKGASTNSEPAKKALNFEKRFTNKSIWTPVDGWFMAKEQDGLYVMAKKVSGKLGDPKGNDEWLFFRTDKPQKFAKTASNISDQLNNSGFFPTKAELGLINEPTWDSAESIINILGEELPEKLVTKKGQFKSKLADIADTAGTYLAPTTMLGTRNPKLNLAFDTIKNLQGSISARIKSFLYGETKFGKGATPLSHSIELDPKRTGGFVDEINKLVKEDLTDIQTILEEEIPIDEVRKAAQRGIISPQVLTVLQGLEDKSDELFKRLDTLNGVVKNQTASKLLDGFSARKGHYGITRDFPGKIAVYLNDANTGEMVDKATGATVADAIESAERLVAKYTKDGKDVTIGGQVNETLRTVENLEQIKNQARKPGFTKSRGTMLGNQAGKELTHSDLAKLVEKNLERREHYIRDVVLTEKLAPIIDDLERTYPKDAVALQNVLNRVQGNEGQFAAAQNKMMDKALASVGLSGSNSASEIVRMTQKLMAQFQFTFGSLTNPLLNIIGTTQTILPELAYGLHATPEQLARSYSAFPLYGNKGVQGSINMLSAPKMFWNAMQTLGTDFDKLPSSLQRTYKLLTEDGTLTARGIEEQFGVNGALLKDIPKALKEGKFVETLSSANELLMTKTEEMARMFAAAAGHDLALVRGIPEDRIPMFVKSFIAKTQFNYGTSDRAHIFTGPVGSLAGTFKNWMFHYMGNMLRYSTGGKEALPALFWQTMTTGLLGGTAATPLLTPILDGASKFLSDKSYLENLYGMFGEGNENIADGLMYGLPSMMGVSLASQTASPASDPERDAQMLFSFAIADRMKNLGQATKDALSTYEATGQSPFEDEVVRSEMVRALAPRSIYRALAVAENNAVQSLRTGYDVMPDIGLGGKLLYASGFNPVELDKTYAVYNEIRNDQEKKKTAVKELGQAMAQAWENKDEVAANLVEQRAMGIGVDYSSVLRSAKAIQKRKEQSQLEFVLTPKNNEGWEFMLDEQPK